MTSNSYRHLATLFMLFVAIPAASAVALAPVTAWTPAETILAFSDGNVRPDVFGVTVIDSGPILFFSHQNSNDPSPPLLSVEKNGGTWQTSTVLDAAHSPLPRFVQAVNLNGSPAIGVGFGNGSLQILSRTAGTWQQLFSDPQVDGLSNFEEHMGLTVANDHLVAAYDDDVYRRDVTVVEQTATSWTSTSHVLSYAAGLDLVSATTINGKPAVFGSGVSTPALIGEKNNSAQWVSSNGPTLTLGKITSWQNQPAAVGSKDYAGAGDILFSYRDGTGVWHSETVRSGTGFRSTDIDVINGRPYVAYFGVGADAGVHVASRLDNGTWLDERVSTSGHNDYLDAIALFQYNGRPGVAWLDQTTSSLNISYNVPEPAAHLLVILAIVIIGTFNNRRPVGRF